MTTEAVARRALCNVQAALWIVRFIFFMDIAAGTLSMVFRGADWWGIVLLCTASVAFFHPLLLYCVNSQNPATGNKPCQIYGKYVLYFWLFVLNCAVTPLFTYGVYNNYIFIFYDTPAVQILLFVVGLVSCLALMVVNLYTFCILHKNGCCFMYTLRQDIEEAAATTNIALVATASECISNTRPEATLPCNPPPYSVSVQPEEHVQTFAAEKQPWEQF